LRFADTTANVPAAGVALTLNELKSDTLRARRNLSIARDFGDGYVRKEGATVARRWIAATCERQS